MDRRKSCSCVGWALRIGAALWVLVLIAAGAGSAPFAYDFIEKTRIDFDVPKGSPLREVKKIVSFFNWNWITGEATYLAVTATDGLPLWDDAGCAAAGNGADTESSVRSVRQGHTLRVEHEGRSVQKGSMRARGTTAHVPRGPVADLASQESEDDRSAEEIIAAVERRQNKTIAARTQGAGLWTVPPAQKNEMMCTCVSMLADALMEMVEEAHWASYFTPIPGLPRSKFVSADRRSTVIMAYRLYMSSTKLERILASPQVHGPHQCIGTNRAIVTAGTNVDLALHDTVSSVVPEIRTIDLISLPIAFVLLVLAVSSVRFVALPIIALPLALLVAFGSLRPLEVAKGMSPIAPEMISAIVIALIIDYALFIIVQFRAKATFFALARPKAAARLRGWKCFGLPSYDAQEPPVEEEDTSTGDNSNEVDDDAAIAPVADTVNAASSEHSGTAEVESNASVVIHADDDDEPGHDDQAPAPGTGGDDAGGARRWKIVRYLFGPPLPQDSVLDEVEVCRRARLDAIAAAELPMYKLQLLVVVDAVGSAARNVLFSGTTIALFFAAAAVLPNKLVRLESAGCAVGAAVAMLVTFLLMPAVLFVLYVPLTINIVPAVVYRTLPTWVCGHPDPGYNCCAPCDERCPVGNDGRDSEAEIDSLHRSALDADALPPAFTHTSTPHLGPGSSNPTHPSGTVNQRVADDEANGLSAPLLKPAMGEPQPHSVNHTKAHVRAASDAEKVVDGSSSVLKVEDGELIPQDATDVHAAYMEAELQAQQSSPWWRLVVLVTTHPIKTCAIFALTAVPIAVILALYLRVDINIYAEVPPDAKHVVRLKDITTKFGGELGGTFGVLVSSLRNTDWNDWHSSNLMTPMVWPYLTRLTQGLQKHLKGAGIEAYVNSPVIGPDGDFLDFNEFQTLLYGDPPNGWFTLIASLLSGEPQDSTVLYLQILLKDTDPWGASSVAVYNALSKAIDDAGTYPDAVRRVGFFGPNAVSYVVMDDIIAGLPMAVGLTFAVMLLCSLFAFRSLFIAVRMCLTVAFTVAFAFGITVAAFCAGKSDTGGVGQNVVALMWPVVPLGFSVVAAVTLDYDSFVLARVVDLRARGFSDIAAVRKAVYRTGYVISYAGLTMTAAFGSLMFADSIVLKQFGCLVGVAVLVDAFFVRPMLVPALMAVLPRLLWWPRKFLDPRFGDDDMNEHD